MDQAYLDTRVYTGTPWERKIGCCRARRIDRTVWVAGTSACDDDGNLVGRDNMYLQAKYILEKISAALQDCGSCVRDVVRTRVYLTDIARFDEVARAHRERFEGVDPVTTCIEVRRLVSADFLVEIEVDAYVRNYD